MTFHPGALLILTTTIIIPLPWTWGSSPCSSPSFLRLLHVGGASHWQALHIRAQLTRARPRARRIRAGWAIGAFGYSLSRHLSPKFLGTRAGGARTEGRSGGVDGDMVTHMLFGGAKLNLIHYGA
ncbi:hypothetical protein BC834DRAFT_553747 [Gloeopeniophorella convolvens]|nr:hypothetical protein BC834DRAFT_553747 [Gloeopeniophorella convolvens]